MRPIRIIGSFIFLLGFLFGVLIAGVLPAIAAPLTPAQLADNLYKSVVEKKPVAPNVKAILNRLGFPIITAAAPRDAVEAALIGGNPVVFAGQERLMASLLQNGRFVDLNSFIAEINSKGFTQPDGKPVTAAYLAAQLRYVENKTTLAPSDILPALLVELAKARTKWLHISQSVSFWRDGLLDPVQTYILYTAFMYTAKVQTPTLAPPPGADGDTFKEFLDLLKKVKDGIPTVEDLVCLEIAQKSVGGAGNLNPTEVWHRQESNIPAFQSRITTTVTRKIVPSNLPSLVDELIDCQLPPVGPIAGMTVAHKLFAFSGVKHGAVAPVSVFTDGFGVARSTFTAVKETTPPMERTPDRVRSDNVIVLGLVSGIYRKMPDVITNIWSAGQGVNYYTDGWSGTVFHSDIITAKRSTSSNGCTGLDTIETSLTEKASLARGVTTNELSYRATEMQTFTCGGSGITITVTTTHSGVGSASGQNLGGLRVWEVAGGPVHEVAMPTIPVRWKSGVHAEQTIVSDACPQGCTTVILDDSVSSVVPMGGFFKNVTAEGNRLRLSETQPPSPVSTKIGVGQRTVVYQINLTQED